jgi:hypothetical protein
MILIRVLVGVLAIIFGSMMVYLVMSGHMTFIVFGTELTRSMMQAACFVCMVVLVLLNWKLVVGIFNRDTRG